MHKDTNRDAERFRAREQREREHREHLPGEDEESLPPPVEPIHTDAKLGRNDPCPCGSGKKYKQCCGKGAK